MDDRADEVAKWTEGKSAVYEFMGRYFTAKDGEIFEMTNNGMVRLFSDVTQPHESVLFYRPRLWFSSSFPTPTTA